MATAREHLNSVIMLAGALQELDDAALEPLTEWLVEADDAMTDAVNATTP